MTLKFTYMHSCMSRAPTALHWDIVNKEFTSWSIYLVILNYIILQLNPDLHNFLYIPIKPCLHEHSLENCQLSNLTTTQNSNHHYKENNWIAFILIQIQPAVKKV